MGNCSEHTAPGLSEACRWMGSELRTLGDNENEFVMDRSNQFRGLDADNYILGRGYSRRGVVCTGYFHLTKWMDYSNKFRSILIYPKAMWRIALTIIFRVTKKLKIFFILK